MVRRDGLRSVAKCQDYLVVVARESGLLVSVMGHTIVLWLTFLRDVKDVTFASLEAFIAGLAF